MAWGGRGSVVICILGSRIFSFGRCSSGKLTSGAATELRGSLVMAGLLMGRRGMVAWLWLKVKIELQVNLCFSS